MAKKTPVKKSRRRLKRSVRRSLSAVLMITAIGVAAIPVPENYALPEDGIATYAIATDPHDKSGFGYEDSAKLNGDEDEIVNTGTTNTGTSGSIELNRHKDKTLDQLIADDTYYMSLATTKLTEGSYDLSWQFMYYETREPDSQSQRNVICWYNNQYSTDELDLDMNPVTQYYEVPVADYEAYYNAGEGEMPSTAHQNVMKHMDFDPTAEIVYEYIDYKDESGMSDQAGLKFLQDYCGGTNGLYTQKKAAWAQYDVDWAAWNAQEDKDPDDEPQKPGALTVIPSELSSEVFTTEQRLKFFCDHDKNLVGATGYGKGYTLVRVGDGRPLKAGETSDTRPSALYLARGGEPVKDNGADNDKYGFLTIERSKYPICAIGNGAFKKVGKVTNMTIPSMIGYIGDEAFADATLLESIQIDNVARIGNRAFQGCVSLSDVKIAQGTETIGADCFSGTAIQTIELPKSMRIIGYGAFSNCKNLTSINLNGMSTACVVKDYAFYNCTALNSIQMEEANITYLGKGAFAIEEGSSQSMGVVLPQGMSSQVTLNGNTVNSIGDYLFAGRTNLQYVVFPPNYGRSETTNTKIPDAMFHNCSNLQYVEFPTTDSDTTACGYLSYDPEKLFADVANDDFYVKGPKSNSSGRGSVATPRETTWDAETATSDTVPYMYVENGVEYYEVSDGFYLLCVNDEGNHTGKLTSCTFKPNLTTDQKNNWTKKGAKLIIPATVGRTTVTGIANNCFTDSELNQKVRELIIEDDSISTIASGTFRGADSDDGDWQALETVYIGNTVTEIGANAFYNCKLLTDVTFSSPVGGNHEALQIGDHAFTTNSKKLTFHGDIAVGYDPFEWAMNPENVINKDDGLFICYKSLAPSYLTVMYNQITEMVTLLDYPKYTEIDTLLNAEYAEEIAEDGFDNYQHWRENAMYNIYRDSIYDSYRTRFADAWKSTGGGEEAQKALYDTGTYGPWVTPEFCDPSSPYYWENYLTKEEPGEGEEEEEEDEDDDLSSSALKSVADWLFEPIVAYAATNPKPYYDLNPYIVTKATEAASEFYRTTPVEQQLVLNTKNIVIPEGVESIDVRGFVNNWTVEGKRDESIAASNTANVGTYLRTPTGWNSKSQTMYEEGGTDEDDEVDIIPGLFSGYYLDDDAAPRGEKRERGNDVIYSVKMNSVKYLPDYAFDSCENLTTVELGPALADIGKAPFRGCYNLSAVGGNDYYFEDECIIYSYNSDGSYTIEECLAGRGNIRGNGTVNSIFDPSILNVSYIQPGAFEDCDNLSEVDFGSNNTAGLREIPEDCFRNCDGLTKVTLPMTVNDVGPNSFVGANNLNTLVVYGKEVKISGSAFRNNKDEYGNGERTRTTVRSYADSAVVRYVKEYGTEYNLYLDVVNPLGEVWEVSFYDQNYKLIENMKSKEDGSDLSNPQYVENSDRPVTPEDPADTDDWTFERWVGTNNVILGDRIYENVSFYAQGYSTSGMVNGKYPVTFWDGVDGTQVGDTQYIEPGKSAYPPAHPVHDGYDADGYSDDYTNIQSPKTIIMKYKVNGTAGSGTGTGTGTGSSGTTQTTSNTSGSTSNTSSSTSSSSTSTSSSTSGSDGAVGKYTVTVENGSGSGSYDVGSTVIIAANAPAAGMTFQKWTTESEGVTLASVSMTATTFVMPANNVTVTANYVAGGTSNISGTGSTGNTTGTTGNTRVDITKPGISNKDLATANVNGSTDNFIVRISETDEATRAVAEALTNKYGSLENILYYAMDISLYDSTGTVKITNTQGLSVDITIPIPDALVAYGGNNMAGAVINGNQLENLNESFTTINGVPCIRFTATHFSPYTIYVDTGNLTEGMLDVTPKTGDPIHPKWFLSIGLACLSVILFMKKDKAVKVKTA